MYIKIHKKGESTVIALCDQDLIGKRFEQNNLQLDINERFYKGEIKTEEEIIKILKNAPIINIVGKKSN